MRRGTESASGDRIDFMFSSGPSRRFLAEMSPEGIRASQIIPGGQCDALGSSAYASMLGRWLTNSYHPLVFTEAAMNAVPVQEERFTPSCRVVRTAAGPAERVSAAVRPSSGGKRSSPARSPCIRNSRCERTLVASPSSDSLAALG